MDTAEGIAYNYLKELYTNSKIEFEPNGHTTFPDIKCADQEFEVASLYQKLDHRCIEEHEAPIIKKVNDLVKKYNNKNIYGYYYSISIQGSESLDKNETKRLDEWFKNNNAKIVSQEFKTRCLKIRLQPQNLYKEKYVSAGLINHNRGGWVFEEYKKALCHIIDKKKKKNLTKVNLIIVDMSMTPLIHKDIAELDFSNTPFKIIVLNQDAKVKYIWN